MGLLGGLFGGIAKGIGGLAGGFMKPLGNMLQNTLPGLGKSSIGLPSPGGGGGNLFGGGLLSKLMSGGGGPSGGIPGSLRPPEVGMPSYQAEAQQFLQNRPSKSFSGSGYETLERRTSPNGGGESDYGTLESRSSPTDPNRGSGWHSDYVPTSMQVERLGLNIGDTIKSVGSPLSPDFFRRMAKIESGGNPNAVSPKGAKGLFQFTRDTWKGYGKGDPFDPSASTAAAVKLANSNYNYLNNKLGRAPTEAEVYMAHNIGPYGAYRLLSADPNMPVTKALISSNPEYNPKFLTNNGKQITAEQAIRNYRSHFGG